MDSRRSKSALIDELIREFRASTNHDLAFDHLAAELLGINETDLHCLNIIENSGGLSAGELANRAGVSAGAVTGVIDRLDRAGFARRTSDPSDRRRVNVEVTTRFYERVQRIWGPVASDWHRVLTESFTRQEITRIIDFLRKTNEVGRDHLRRLEQDA